MSILTRQNPGFENFKIAKTGLIQTAAVSITAGGAGVWQEEENEVSIVHGLGYVPAYLAYIDIGSEKYQLPFLDFGSGSSSTVSWTHIYIKVDAQNLKVVTECVSLNSNVSAGQVNVRYYLLEDLASS